MTSFTRVFIVAFALWSLLNGGAILATPPEEPVAPGHASIYNPDPAHLWNRLHRTLWVRTGPNGKEYGHDRLDPYLWRETKHLLEGDSHKLAIAVLDEFLSAHGENQEKEPLKRAMLQRDLWAVFDWTTEGSEKKHAESSRALQTRLAKVIQRLALTPEQIKGLPDNYAAAVAAKSFAEKHDPDHPESPFLPPDLLQKDGLWVEVVIDNSSAVTASRHVLDFGARSAFRVFLRLPAGRKETLAYLKSLNDFPRRWLAGEDQKGDLLRLNWELPQFPVGTEVALVRQMLLINKDGELAPSSLTESVQLRVFRAIPKLEPGQDPLQGKVRVRGDPDTQDSYEFILGRLELFAGKNGGLRAIRRDEKDFRTQLLVLNNDEFESPGNDDFEKHMGQTMRSCLGCHDRPGIFSVQSYTGDNYPRPRYYLPFLSNGDGDEQAHLSAQKKREQFSWGLLRGLWEQQPR
ncbi:MAG: hypothetical protein K8R36_08655 [Planctomycetales bacterium]|nr:hypothetical protein [Planctomycetales bacterium]